MIPLLYLLAALALQDTDYTPEFAKEAEAQRHERTFIRFWDDLIHKEDKLAAFKSQGFESLLLGNPGAVTEHPWGVKAVKWDVNPRRLAPADWTRLLDDLTRAGWRLVESEWHHAEFDVDPDGTARSKVNFQLHVERKQTQERIFVRGPLRIRWSGRKDSHGNPFPAEIDASGVTLLERKGPTPFQEGALWRFKTMRAGPKIPGVTASPEPIVLYDLNGDGRSEIITGGWNLIFWSGKGGNFDGEELVTPAPNNIEAAQVADFNGDALPDLLVTRSNSLPALHEGRPGGRFDPKGRPLGAPKETLLKPMAITSGDIDGDGDLDLWIVQYKEPYSMGQMPTPYYDANDGYPSYLLKNDGKGNFEEATEAAGLAKKRFRRTYSASFVDLDDDHDLDLVVVSDFSGVDFHLNDGKGSFTDVTTARLDDVRLYGMAHTFEDYDRDGRLDLYAIGMGSTTARRLEHMKLGRKDMPVHDGMRLRMGYGNRMYMGRADGTFKAPPFQESVARTGWAWGVTSNDFDLDGWPDLYVANGHRSGKSTADYCTSYWCRDIYMGTSKEDGPLSHKFADWQKDLLKYETSWNGYEHNALLMNREGKDFLSAGWLMGVAYEADSRAVAGDDVNGDGKVDLVLTTWDREGAAANPSIRIATNLWPGKNHWIGVRLKEEGPGLSPIGAKITVAGPGGRRTLPYVTGDSYRTQHAPARVFGLGAETRVDYVEVRWPNGTVRRIDSPAIDRYHSVFATAPPPEARSPLPAVLILGGALALLLGAGWIFARRRTA